MRSGIACYATRGGEYKACTRGGRRVHTVECTHVKTEEYTHVHTEGSTHRDDYTRGNKSTHRGVYTRRSVRTRGRLKQGDTCGRSLHVEKSTNGRVHTKESTQR